MKQHAGLTVERWAQLSLDQRILSIAAEMLRVRHSIAHAPNRSIRLGYERVLRLVDLTVAANRDSRLWRELLRWRDLVAGLYIADTPRLDEHVELMRCLLRFRFATAKQVAYL